MSEAHRLVAALLLAVLSGACEYPIATPSGMRPATARRHQSDPAFIELARVDTARTERPLLVIYPKSACSGTASGVLIDEEGHFLGAVAPGTGTLLAIPTRLRELVAFSSVEVTAPAGTWHAATRVAIPAAPSGLLLRASRWNTRECGDGHYFDVASATKEDLEIVLGEHELQWLSPSPREGQAWLAAHSYRIADLLSRLDEGLPSVITHSSLR